MYCFQKNGISQQITFVRLTTVLLGRALLFVRMLSWILYFSFSPVSRIYF